MNKSEILNAVKDALAKIQEFNLDEKVDTLNEIKLAMKQVSPFKAEPVDCVVWVKKDNVVANDYNPNSVAPPEMKLLETSIQQDGYTQPIVSWKRDGIHEVVDGFHRNRVGKECAEVTERIHGYLPLTVINQDREDLGDRMASTVRHNRARGKHSVDSMSDMVIELKKRNRSDEWIAKNLGMDADEVLRLCQISGLTEMFADTNFSKAWDIGEIEDEGLEGHLLEPDTTDEQAAG